MLGRAARPMLAIEEAGPTPPGFKLTCTPPKEFDPSWKRDGIENGRLGSGDRSFWTVQVLGAVPPSYWSNELGLEPSALIAAIALDRFADRVIEGWIIAARKFARIDAASAEWLEPLCQHLSTSNLEPCAMNPAVRGCSRAAGAMSWTRWMNSLAFDAATSPKRFLSTRLIHRPSGWFDNETLDAPGADRRTHGAITSSGGFWQRASRSVLPLPDREALFMG